MYRKYRKKNAAGGAEGAVKAAVSLLAFKENTEKELYGKLLAKGYSEEDSAAALRFVVEKNYLSEGRYFLRFVEYYGSVKRYGKKRILQEAYKKGFSEKTLSEHSEEAFGRLDFNALCYEELGKSAPSREKAAAQLLRRGFSSENVRRAFERWLFEHGTPFGSEDEGEEND